MCDAGDASRASSVSRDVRELSRPRGRRSGRREAIAWFARSPPRASRSWFAMGTASGRRVRSPSRDRELALSPPRPTATRTSHARASERAVRSCASEKPRCRCLGAPGTQLVQLAAQGRRGLPRERTAESRHARNAMILTTALGSHCRTRTPAVADPRERDLGWRPCARIRAGALAHQRRGARGRSSDAFAVTIEPQGVHAAADGPIILLGKVPASVLIGVQPAAGRILAAACSAHRDRGAAAIVSCTKRSFAICCPTARTDSRPATRRPRSGCSARRSAENQSSTMRSNVPGE